MKRNIALFIDADNIGARYAESIFLILGRYGNINIRRIYGNWRKNYDWTEEIISKYSLKPIQQFDNVKGKNATDIALVIDVMSIVNSYSPDIVCIVTSDSDFTALSVQLRECGIIVIGMGESKTASSFRCSCRKFIFLDKINDIKSADTQKQFSGKKKEEKQKAVSNTSGNSKINSSIKNAGTDTKKNTSVFPSVISLLRSGLGNIFRSSASEFDIKAKKKISASEINKKQDIACVSDIFSTANENKNTDKLSDISGSGKTQAKVSDKSYIDQIRCSVSEYIESQGGKVNTLSYINTFINSYYSDFDYKKYGYKRLTDFVMSIDGITVENNQAFSEQKFKPLSVDNIKEEIIDFVRSNGGKVSNCSQINDYLRKAYNITDYKKYGYNKFSELIKSIPQLEENKNSVFIRENLPDRNKVDEMVLNYVRSAGANGANISMVNEYLKKKIPGFSSKLMGYSKFSKYLASVDGVEVKGNVVRMVR